MKSIFLVMLIASTLQAGELKTEITGDIKKIYYDDNDDKKADLIESYKAGVLVKKEVDQNFDGKFEEIHEYTPYSADDRPIEVITKGSAVTKVYKNLKEKLIISTTKDGDNVFTTSQPLTQKRDQDCNNFDQALKEKFTPLSKDVNKALGQLQDGFILTDAGYKVHKSCLDNWGAAKFQAILKNAMSTGMSCMQKLAANNTKKNPSLPNGALRNVKQLERILKNDHVTVVCNENRDWKGTAGHASTGPDSTMKSLPSIKHPYLSLNPNDPEKKTKPSAEETEEFERTLFHEQLHNLGIKHGEGIEYPYTCESCCLPSKDRKPEEITSACKVCAGQYDNSGTKDISYIKDMIEFGANYSKRERAITAAENYLLANPKSVDALALLTQSKTNTFSAVGVEMGKIMKETIKNQTAEVKEAVFSSDFYAKSAHISSVAPQAKVVAQSTISLYFNRDQDIALGNLVKNKSLLKTIISNAKRKDVSDEQQWTNEQLKEDLNNLLKTIWLDGYPEKKDSPNSRKAYDLMVEVGLL